MGRTAIRIGGVELKSSIMNASGVRSAERGEIYELCAVHSGALVFKSCNMTGLEQPENLRNRGAEHFAAIATELSARGKAVVGSVVGESGDEIVSVARRLDRAGVHIIELNFADDFVIKSVNAFSSLKRLDDLLGRVRGETEAVLAVKLPAGLDRSLMNPVVAAFNRRSVAIAVCWNDLPKDLDIDLKAGRLKGPKRLLSQAHAFFSASGGTVDIVAVGGVSSGREAYVAHLTGARGVQVGSALIKEGAGALGRIDRELDACIAENGRRNVSEIVGALQFAP